MTFAFRQPINPLNLSTSAATKVISVVHDSIGIRFESKSNRIDPIRLVLFDLSRLLNSIRFQKTDSNRTRIELDCKRFEASMKGIESSDIESNREKSRILSQTNRLLNEKTILFRDKLLSIYQ